MEQGIVFQNIERILNEWDPIGILQDFKPIEYNSESIGEYSMYVKTIILAYLSNKSIYDFLVDLQTDLYIYPTNEMKEEIKLITKEITEFLSTCRTKDLIDAIE